MTKRNTANQVNKANKANHEHGSPDPIPISRHLASGRSDDQSGDGGGQYHHAQLDPRGGAAPGNGGNLPSHVPLPYLKAWRAARGMTQQQLAGRAGCTAETVRRIEHGRAAQVLTAAELARALAVPLDALRHTDPTLHP